MDADRGGSRATLVKFSRAEQDDSDPSNDTSLSPPLSEYDSDYFDFGYDIEFFPFIDAHVSKIKTKEKRDFYLGRDGSSP